MTHAASPLVRPSVASRPTTMVVHACAKVLCHSSSIVSNAARVMSAAAIVQLHSDGPFRCVSRGRGRGGVDGRRRWFIQGGESDSLDQTGHTIVDELSGCAGCTRRSAAVRWWTRDSPSGQRIRGRVSGGMWLGLRRRLCVGSHLGVVGHPPGAVHRGSAAQAKKGRPRAAPVSAPGSTRPLHVVHAMLRQWIGGADCCQRQILMYAGDRHEVGMRVLLCGQSGGAARSVGDRQSSPPAILSRCNQQVARRRSFSPRRLSPDPFLPPLDAVPGCAPSEVAAVEACSNIHPPPCLHCRRHSRAVAASLFASVCTHAHVVALRLWFCS